METKSFLYQWASGAFAALGGFLYPIQGMLMGVLIFIVIDFIIGCFASYKRAKKRNVRWYFESSKIWNTIEKLVFSLVAVSLSYYLEEVIFDFVDLKLPNIVSGFICGTEFWSFLENAGDISEHKVFRAIKKITRRKVNQILDNKD